MKVLGKTENGFLVGLTMGEMAHLLGESDTLYMNGRVGIGDELDVAGLWHALEKLKRVQSEMGHVATHLRALADSIDILDPVADKFVKVVRDASDGKEDPADGN